MPFRCSFSRSTSLAASTVSFTLVPAALASFLPRPPPSSPSSSPSDDPAAPAPRGRLCPAPLRGSANGARNVVGFLIPNAGIGGKRDTGKDRRDSLYDKTQVAAAQAAPTFSLLAAASIISLGPGWFPARIGAGGGGSLEVFVPSPGRVDVPAAERCRWAVTAANALRAVLAHGQRVHPDLGRIRPLLAVSGGFRLAVGCELRVTRRRHRGALTPAGISPQRREADRPLLLLLRLLLHGLRLEATTLFHAHVRPMMRFHRSREAGLSYAQSPGPAVSPLWNPSGAGLGRSRYVCAVAKFEQPHSLGSRPAVDGTFGRRFVRRPSRRQRFRRPLKLGMRRRVDYPICYAFGGAAAAAGAAEVTGRAAEATGRTTAGRSDGATDGRRCAAGAKQGPLSFKTASAERSLAADDRRTFARVGAGAHGVSRLVPGPPSHATADGGTGPPSAGPSFSAASDSESQDLHASMRWTNAVFDRAEDDLRAPPAADASLAPSPDSLLLLLRPSCCRDETRRSAAAAAACGNGACMLRPKNETPSADPESTATVTLVALLLLVRGRRPPRPGFLGRPPRAPAANGPRPPCLLPAAGDRPPPLPVSFTFRPNLRRNHSTLRGRRHGQDSRLSAGRAPRLAARRAGRDTRREAAEGSAAAAEDGGVAPPPVDDAATAAVYAPEHEGGVVKRGNPAADVLGHAALAVTRQLEMLNIFLGFEQANRYAIADVHGNPLGFIAEEDGFASAVKRQLFRNHRPFKATVMNSAGEVILRVERPFAFVNSRATVSLPDGRVIGGVYQRWHLWRRRYDLVALAPGRSLGKRHMRQFAAVDAPFLSWDFKLQDERGGLLGTVDRNFSGFAREIFTDTGHYVLRMDSVDGGAIRPLTLDERAVTLGAAISIDIDYFSRNRGGIGIPVPISVGGAGGTPVVMPMPVGGAVGAAEAAEIGAGAAAGAAAGGAAAAAGGYTPRGWPPQPPESDLGPPPTTAPEAGGGGSPAYNEWGDEVAEDEGFVSDDEAFPDDGGGRSWAETLSDFIWDDD
ncbi:MAG: Scramblase-domain-containing protein [Olpidium bornovanus]|uniref:Scramblase-domain-containing protein n=1 Tax=Olpidium bornovanus TaxID=278681 RepID=A0A8H7ZMH8_9FUNG|nr:MAG: Scramblase-domain-containing protein [Olpidium bornovanus]